MLKPIAQFNEKYSIPQTVKDLPDVMVNLTHLLGKDNIDAKAKGRIVSQILLIRGILEMFATLETLSFHRKKHPPKFGG